MPRIVFRQIAQLGNPILREKTKPIVQVKNVQVQQLIDDMIATVQEVDGVGIAAPQVFSSLQVFIIASKPNPRYPHAPLMRPLAMINPHIQSSSEKKVYEWEGCLSVPGIRGLVPRFTSLQIRYTSRSGKKFEKTLDGFIARIFQHEYDHIHGLVFLDRVDTNQTLISENEYQKMMRKKYIHQTLHEKQ